MLNHETIRTQSANKRPVLYPIEPALGCYCPDTTLKPRWSFDSFLSFHFRPCHLFTLRRYTLANTLSSIYSEAGRALALTKSWWTFPGPDKRPRNRVSSMQILGDTRVDGAERKRERRRAPRLLCSSCGPVKHVYACALSGSEIAGRTFAWTEHLRWPRLPVLVCALSRRHCPS